MDSKREARTGQNCEPVYTVRMKSLGFLSPTFSFRGPKVSAKRVTTRKKTSQMLFLFSPSFQVHQVTVADKMPVEDVKLLGDQCYMNRKCFYMQNTGEWLSQKSSNTRQRIDETVSFPFSWSPAKKFLSHLRRMESTGGLSPLEDCRAKVSTDLNTTTTRGIDHSVSAAAN